MSDGEVAARGRADDSAITPLNTIAGQAKIRELLALQRIAPRRSALARFFGISPLAPDARDAYNDAIGEIEVGRALGTLPSGWTVIHAVPVGEGSATIDHLVVGPSGVYIVTTKVHSGQVVVASQRTFVVADIRHPYIRSMEYEMGRVERLLSTAAHRSVEVSGLLAVVDSKTLEVTEGHRDVDVIDSSTIVRWLLGRPRIMQPDEMELITSVSVDPATWHAESLSVDETRELKRDFERLHHDVTRAWNRQKMWATIATVVGAGGFILVTYAILVNALQA